MNTKAALRMNRRAVIWALLCVTFTGNALASAGRIDFSIGGVVATRPDGRQRPLIKGAELQNGDTIHTNNGRAQIRFPDGAYVSLQPNTVFGVKEYNYNGKPDGTERGFFSLLKGAVRAVTGLIGRVHHNAFAIKTPTATVGIRGTGGLIEVLPDGSTLIRGSSGIWTLSNPSGSIDVPAGTSGLAPADPSQPPQETSETPSVPPAPLGTAGSGFVAGDERTDTGAPIIPVIPLQSGSGYAAALAYPGSGAASGTWNLSSSGGATAVFNSLGQLTSVNLPCCSFFGPFVLQSGSNVDFGTDGILAWGRWTGDVTIPIDISAPPTLGQNQGVPYVIGMPTPNMPINGSATYTLLGATQPTHVDGSTAPGVFSGTINVNFGARAGATVGMDFTVAMPDTTYHLSGSSTATSALFRATPAVTIGGSACVSAGCSASVDGFFAGASAERIGVGYQITDSQTTVKQVVGTAAFTK